MKGLIFIPQPNYSNADKVRNELDNLARQQALQMGANTIVRQSIVSGKGTYIAYGCP